MMICWRLGWHHRQANGDLGKVMFVTEVFSGFGLGGAEVAALARLKYAPAEVQTTLIVSQGRKAAQLLPTLPGVRSRFVACGSDTRDLRAAVSESRPDVLVINTPRQAVQLLVASRLPPACPTVIVAHSEVLSDRLALNRPLSLGMRLANPRASLHIAVSRGAATGPWCHGAHRIEVCHLGSEVDSTSFSSEVSWPQDTSLRLLTLSRLTQPKNLSTLLHSMSRLAHDLRRARAHLRIVGTGPEKSRLMRDVSRLGLGDLVSFFGPTHIPASWLATTDWLLIPSVAEGGPLTLYEAAQTGARVMGTPRGAMPDVLARDPESILVGGTDVRAVTRGLSSILEAPSRLTERDRRRRMTIGRAWSVESLAPSWYRTLASVA